MDKKIYLKPCPFCGCDDIRIVGYKADLSDLCLECVECLIEVKYSDCIQSAIKLWNTRTKEGLNDKCNNEHTDGAAP